MLPNFAVRRLTAGGTMPPFFRDGLRRRGVEAVGPTAFARIQVLLAAVGGGQALPRGGPVGKGGGSGPPAAGSLQASSLGFALLAASRADASVSWASLRLQRCSWASEPRGRLAGVNVSVFV